MSILLKNATYINWENLHFSKTNILVNKGENGNIEFITNPDKINSYDKTIDCKGKLVTKSFAVGHHHVYSALSRGMPAPQKSPNNFYEILKTEKMNYLCESIVTLIFTNFSCFFS